MKLRTIVSLAACVVVVSSAPALSKKITLQIWDWHKPRMDVIKAKAEAYQKLHPNIEIKLSMTSWDAFPSKLLASVVGGTPPDITQFHNAWTSRLLKILAPFPPEYFPSSQMVDKFYQFNTAFRMNDGKFYFYPDGLMAPLIFYNTKLWAQAGLSSTPKTWDEMRAVSKKLTQIDGAGRMIVGGFSFSPAYLFDDMNYQLGGGIYNESHTGVAWYTEEGRKAITMLGSMALNDGTRTTAPFEGGKVAMAYQWTHYKGTLLTISPQKLQWSTFVMPTFNGGEFDIRSRNNYECGYAVPANLKPDKKNEAFKFLKWLYSDDNYYVKLNDVLGRLPGRKDLWTRAEIANDPVQKALAKQIPYTVFPGERPDWIDTALQKMEADMMAKKRSPLDALKAAQAEGDRQWKIQPPKWIVERRLPK